MLWVRVGWEFLLTDLKGEVITESKGKEGALIGKITF